MTFPVGAPLSRHDYVVTRVSDIKEARALITAHHYARGGSQTHVYFHGLYHRYSGGLFGVAQWLPPTRVCAESVNRVGWRRVLSLTRLACIPEAPKNAASFLIAGSVAIIRAEGKWTDLVTFADESQNHLGGIYRATNWVYRGRTSPNPRWVDGQGRQVATLATKTRTKAQMLALGYRMVGKFSKHKFTMSLSPKPRKARLSLESARFLGVAL